MVPTVTEEHREPVDSSPEAHFMAHTAKMSTPRRDTEMRTRAWMQGYAAGAAGSECSKPGKMA